MLPWFSQQAIIKQVVADWSDGPLSRLPLSRPTLPGLPNAAIARNLLCAHGSLARPTHGKARSATIRRGPDPCRRLHPRHDRGNYHAAPARRLAHREHEWIKLFTTACGPPPTVAGSAGSATCYSPMAPRLDI